MGTASSYPSDFTLVLYNSPSDSYEMSKVLLARAAFDGTLLRVRCRNGLGKCFRLHRQNDKHEHVMYIVAEETSGNAPGVRRRSEERRSALRQA
jgi:hypothetical protein